ANAAYLIELGNNLIIKPAIQTKFLPGQSLQFDLVANFILLEKLWLNTGIRTNESFFAGMRIKVGKSLWLGYSYDQRLNFTYSEFNASTHEIFINFNINHKNLNHRSPRYF
ncbi:MAG: type IX secretion system membrane protein PorP/SprF, partial [Bacteroidia bacterium]